jgi:hypothetical protein
MILIFARQQLGKHVPAATNTQAVIEEFLDMSFFMRSVYQRKIRDKFFPQIIVFNNTTRILKGVGIAIIN